MVCQRLRGEPCEGCPRYETTHYGRTQRGCYALAQELISIVKRGGPFKSAAMNQRWRKQVEKYRNREAL